jgi:SAM-dependent methyltransferase
MYVIERSLRFMRGALTSYGPSILKKAVWDKEYSAGQWSFNDHTADDCVYSHLEKHTRNGSILDIGCGSGNTANELAANAYQTYLGVDISESALDMARRRTGQVGRTDKNSFAQGDFLYYVPPQRYDVILFRESMYLVPLGKVKETLDRYSKYLKDSGVFVVRICTTHKSKKKTRPTAMLRVMETEFDVIEKRQYGETGPTVIVFRPKVPARSKSRPV